MRPRTSYVAKKPPKPTCSDCGLSLEPDRLGKYRYCRACATAAEDRRRERKAAEAAELRLWAAVGRTLWWSVRRETNQVPMEHREAA